MILYIGGPPADKNSEPYYKYYKEYPKGSANFHIDLMFPFKDILFLVLIFSLLKVTFPDSNPKETLDQRAYEVVDGPGKEHSQETESGKGGYARLVRLIINYVDD